MSHSALGILSGRVTNSPGLTTGVVLDDALIGRIEEWVVSTLDDKNKPSGDEEWRNSLENLTLTKRTGQTRKHSATAPTTQGPWARFRLSQRRGIAIVSLTDQALIKEEDLQELTGDLLSLVEAGHRRIVLDFFAVERLSSWAASVINETIRRCTSAEGNSVKFSGIHPEVAAMFAMIGLDPRVVTYSDTASAVASSWPDLPELRPLPVSILTALMRAEDTRHQPPTRERSLRVPLFRLNSAESGNVVEDHPTMTGARLIVQDGPSMGRTVSIKGAKFVIGRGPDSQLKVGSATVSRSHAAIERRGGRLYLRDLTSTNGTFLNGRRLRDRPVEIRDGDVIQVGKFSLALAIGSVNDYYDRVEELISSRLRSEERADSSSEDYPDVTEEFDNISDLGEEIGLKYEVIDGILVVTPLAKELDDESEVDGFRDALLSLNKLRLPKRVVINLSHITHLSGRAIGVLVAHHLRLDRSGGALRVCLANPRVAVVLEQVKLGMLVDYHQSVEDAVIAAWPQPVAASGRI
jgi:anti-anti-sigma factor